MKNKLYAIPIAFVVLAVAAFGAGVLAENIDPGDNGAQYAWGENAGWLNAEPANCGDCGVQVTNTSLTGYMWGENVGWINLSCKNNATCAGPAGNWGVGNNGAGILSGYAWSENGGWINFSCQTNNACAGRAGNWGVTISGSTGSFSGDAWGENIGWISFSDTSPVAYQVQTSDDDQDGIFAGSDNCPLWANPSQVLPNWLIPAADPDCDGIQTAREQYITTNPSMHCAANSGVNNEPSPDAWPVDFNDDQRVTILDVGKYSAVFGTNSSSPNWNPRFDMAPAPPGAITILDVSVFSQYFGKTCA